MGEPWAVFIEFKLQPPPFWNEKLGVFGHYCQIILMTGASKMQSTFVQGVESTAMPGRIVEPEIFPSPVEGNFPLISNVLPLCKANMVPITMQGYLGQEVRGKLCAEKALPLQESSCKHSPLQVGKGAEGRNESKTSRRCFSDYR